MLATDNAAVPCRRQRRLAPTLERPVVCGCLVFLVELRPPPGVHASTQSARLRLPRSADGKRCSHGNEVCKKNGPLLRPRTSGVLQPPSLLNANEVMNHDLVMSLATHPRNPGSWADCALQNTSAGRELIPIDATQASLVVVVPSSCAEQSPRSERPCKQTFPGGQVAGAFAEGVVTLLHITPCKVCSPSMTLVEHRS